MVIAIIGILGAMILPRLFGPTEQGRSTEARNMLGAIRELEEAYFHGPDGSYLALDADGNTNNFCDQGEGNSWDVLGMVDPNGNSVYFGYCVSVPSAGEFLIIATRTGTADTQNQAGTIMCLNQAGEWSGDYVHIPFNPDNNACSIGPCCGGG